MPMGIFVVPAIEKGIWWKESRSYRIETKLAQTSKHDSLLKKGEIFLSTHVIELFIQMQPRNFVQTKNEEKIIRNYYLHWVPHVSKTKHQNPR
jgi:hypothetical protein